MKKVSSIILLAVFSLTAMSFTYSFGSDIEIVESEIGKTEYQKGFADGHCEGWKDVKGKYAHCPYAPYPDYPAYPKTSDSYQDGYNDGFKRGMRDARKN